MEKYFWGDTITRWAIRLGMFALLPVALTAGFRWYSHGFGADVALRLKVLGIFSLLSVTFLLIAYFKGERISRKNVKQIHKLKP